MRRLERAARSVEIHPFHRVAPRSRASFHSDAQSIARLSKGPISCLEYF